jgi:hypothetical protein
MTFVKLANGHRYFKTLLMADHHVKLLTEEINSDIPWMGKWKLGSKRVDYANAALAQKRGEHRLFDWTNHRMICSCGFSLAGMKSKEKFYRAPGHLDVIGLRLTSVFVVRYLDDDEDGSLKYFCQSCGVIEVSKPELAPREEEDEPDNAKALARLFAFERKHLCKDKPKGKKKLIDGVYEDEFEELITVSGAPTDDGMVWSVYCPLCKSVIGGRSKVGDELRAVVLEHVTWHRFNDATS